MKNMENQLIIPTAEPFLFTAGKTGCVLVHGFTGTPKEMRLMGEALHHKSLSVLGVRLAGHATFPKDLVHTTWMDWLASVEDGIHMLANICEEVFIAGLSLGGMLSLVAASRYPILKGAIAMSAPFSIGNDWRLKIAKPLSLVYPYVRKGESETRDPTTAKEHIDYPVYPLRAVAELNDFTKILHQSLSKIKIPVLLINSKTDQTVPLWQAEKIKEGITSAKVESLIIEESGHVITEDFAREQVFEAAFQFIQKNSQK